MNQNDAEFEINEPGAKWKIKTINKNIAKHF